MPRQGRTREWEDKPQGKHEKQSIEKATRVWEEKQVTERKNMREREREKER